MQSSRAFLRTSDDFGRTWSRPETYSVKFPADSGVALNSIWQICPGRAGEPDTLWSLRPGLCDAVSGG